MAPSNNDKNFLLGPGICSLKKQTFNSNQVVQKMRESLTTQHLAWSSRSQRTWNNECMHRHQKHVCPFIYTRFIAPLIALAIMEETDITNVWLVASHMLATVYKVYSSITDGNQQERKTPHHLAYLQGAERRKIGWLPLCWTAWWCRNRILMSGPPGRDSKPPGPSARWPTSSGQSRCLQTWGKTNRPWISWRTRSHTLWTPIWSSSHPLRASPANLKSRGRTGKRRQLWSRG